MNHATITSLVGGSIVAALFGIMAYKQEVYLWKRNGTPIDKGLVFWLTCGGFGFGAIAVRLL